jgi:iron complex outermembrane recepter protein
MQYRDRSFVLFALTCLVTTVKAQPTNSEEHTAELSPVVVVASKQNTPGVEVIDPKTALQPLPAQDGADLLKSVAGISVIRKGGSSGDPLLRGLGGSRLLISADDQFVLGGCPGRMDPPTSYLFPASYDRVIITKGPQAVNQGPGMISGSVRFIRDEKPLTHPTAKVDSAFTKGSFRRSDAYIDSILGNHYGWLRLNASHNQSKDYKDGNGDTVHSAFKRNNQMVQAALTPFADTLLAMQYEHSTGHARYADRKMDGTQFNRHGWSMKLRQQNLTSWLSQIQFEYGRSKINHVMDNFTLRTPAPMKMGSGMGGMHMAVMPIRRMYSVMNPAREIKSAKLSAQIELGNTHSEIGADWQNDAVSTRPMVMSTNKKQAENYAKLPFVWNQTYKRHGVYVQSEWNLSNSNSLFSGLRHDWTSTQFNPQKNTIAANYLNQHQGLNAGFIRLQHRGDTLTSYIGYGLADRAPDYWERSKVNGEKLHKETNHEIDAGLSYQSNSISSSIDVFASKINNFILIQSINSKNNARQIAARRYGFEARTNWHFAPHWNLGSSLAYTYASNRSDKRPLAQTPPLEWRTYLNWEDEHFSAGALWRVTTGQHRYARNQGNIAGMDLGKSNGFGTLALNAGWKANKNTLVQIGIDNVFNKTYAEAVNKSAYDFDTYSVQERRVKEPGRTLWARAQIRF